MRYAIAATLLVGLGANVAAQADVYRWVDPEGRVHYSDRWMPGWERIAVDARGGQSSGARTVASEQSRLAVSNDRIAAQQAQQAATQAVQQDVAEARDQQCKEARERYEKSIQARRIFRTGANGEREYLTEAEADEWRLQARAEMQQACGSSS